jgi:L-threonylcarbamoyladenylate synthase
MPEILATHTPALFAEAVRRAAERLRSGDVVALPTETVYGLAANALDPAAVQRIYEVKQRPAQNPVIVHVAGAAMARSCAQAWPDSADTLAEAFWPGPLTLVLPRDPRIPDIVTATGPTVGIRWPSHPFIQAVIHACGFPLAAPSANPANQLSPTTAAHVAHLLGSRIPLIIDGGPCQVGIESTVVGLGPEGWRMLRPGMIGADQIEAVLPSARRPQPGNTHESHVPGSPLPSPGQLPRHYAPRATLLCLGWSDDRSFTDQLRSRGIEPADTHVLAHHTIPSEGCAARICVIPDDPEAYARAMYAEWHRSDALGARCIVLEHLPDHPRWAAIRDRVRRAAHPQAGTSAT